MSPSVAEESKPHDATVFVIDDDEQVRVAIDQLARSVGLPVRTFRSAAEFLAAFRPTDRGCVVTDVRMPGMGGLELQEALNSSEFKLPLIVMTGYAEVRMAVQAFQNGAFDFIEKPFSPQKLLDVIQRAIRKDTADSLRRQLLAETRERIAGLSPRETEVMELLVAGKTTKQIANALDIGLTTVDFHRHNTLRKMDVDSVVELARMVAHVEFFNDLS